jgi:hypothetical protein
MRRRRWGRHAVALVCAGLTVACYEGIDPPRGGEQNDDGGSSEGDGDGDGDGDEPAADESDPGRVTVHRLNNTEYDNTIRDLLGTARRPALDFTPDDYSYGFDNISEVLSTSPVQVELYHRAAHDLAVEAMREPIEPEEHVVQAETVGGTTGKVVADGTAWAFMLPGELVASVAPVEPGTYTIEVRAWADQAGPEIAKMQVSVDGEPIHTFDVEATLAAPQVYEVEHAFESGTTDITVAFVNDYHVPEEALDRNLYVDSVTVRGPAGADGTNAIRDRILVCDPFAADQDACVREIVETFGRRAWRRPLEAAEVDAAVGLFDLVLAEGGGPYEGLQVALESFLASPKFLFRFEIDPDPTSLQPRALDDWELASRLSYFVWSSMPDDELFEAAESGTLRDPEELRAQIDRMLADPKADALVHNFASQWLYLRGLEDHLPDLEVLPTFDVALLASMRRETELFFTEFMKGDRPFVEMLTTDVTFVDQGLAAHYGVPSAGAGFQPVSLAGTPRRGLLGQAAILTVTSHPDRTSPVKRGKWVLEELLCSAPPPPPPGVEGVDPEAGATGSARDQLEQHVTDPSCAACHHAMDPIGFSLEHFDPVGQWREMDGPWEIDASGVLPDGQTFDGADELAVILSQDPRFHRCVSEKMMIYALGRGLEPHDDEALDAIEDELAAGGGTLRELVALVATSRPFTHRRGEAP